MYPSHICRVRVTSLLSQSRIRVIQNNFESEPRHDLVESQELLNQFEPLVCKLESMWSQMKFAILLCFLLRNGAQQATKWSPMS